MLLDGRTLVGSELEIGEMTFQPGMDSGEHAHPVVEAFYVISGTLDHVVNGKPRPNATGRLVSGSDRRRQRDL